MSIAGSDWSGRRSSDGSRPTDTMRLESARAASPFALLLGQFRNVLIIVLLGAAGLSALVGEIIDAVVILIIVLFSALLGFFQEYRAGRAVDALKRMLAPTAGCSGTRNPWW